MKTVKFNQPHELGANDRLVIPRDERWIYEGDGPAVVVKGSKVTIEGGGRLSTSAGIGVYFEQGSRGVVRDIWLDGGEKGTIGIVGKKSPDVSRATFFALIDNVQISNFQEGIVLEDGANAWEVRSCLMWRIWRAYYKLNCAETLISGGFCHLQADPVDGHATVLWLHSKAQHNSVIGLRAEPTGKSDAYRIEAGAAHNQIIAQLNCSHRGYNHSDKPNYIQRRGAIVDLSTVAG